MWRMCCWGLGVGQDEDRMLEFGPGDVHWNKLVGCDNVKGFVYMLGNHQRELGKKRLRKIILEWRSEDSEVVIG